MSTRSCTRLTADTDVIRIPARPKVTKTEGNRNRKGTPEASKDLSVFERRKQASQLDFNPFGVVSTMVTILPHHSSCHKREIILPVCISRGFCVKG